MIIVALDVDTRQEALELVDLLKGRVSFFKIGMQLYNSQGPAIVSQVKEKGVKVFLDLKFHDIPNTVGAASAVAVRMGADMFNLHASGGEAMLRKAVESAQEEALRLNRSEKPLIIGVTVLTSMNQAALEQLGINRPLEQQVKSLAELCQGAGLDGVVASPKEIKIIRESCGKDFVIVTPGVRPLWASRDDQERVNTPGEAAALGASYLVIGRPITAAADPGEALDKILAEIE
ncbi:orotidine-5'-phosphate decarboxylase [Candidatus Contubernalis alkalaceticus]|nr:orotidine-5'-phosphate decarboxylase [Candidatus Contubernalis alkalaceticus]